MTRRSEGLHAITSGPRKYQLYMTQKMIPDAVKVYWTRTVIFMVAGQRQVPRTSFLCILTNDQYAPFIVARSPKWVLDLLMIVLWDLDSAGK